MATRNQIRRLPHARLEVPPPRTSRFGSPLVLSRVHWVRPELVAEVKYRTWTATEVRREMPHPKSGVQD
jgi:bifunctional non-homologous end joining protein LigD